MLCRSHIFNNRSPITRLFYDQPSDTLQVGFNTYGIGGDVDGDGDGGSTSAWLGGLGGVDSPHFGGTEGFALLLDIDEDGIADVTAGVSAATDISGYSVNEFSGSLFVPSLAFGASLPGNIGSVFGSPSVAAPDLEFSITNFSTLPISSALDAALNTFGFTAFMGSFSDAGVGEDFVPGLGSFAQATISTQVPAVPIPPALWLFGTALAGMIGFAKRRIAA